jgi:hypothetical protein
LIEAAYHYQRHAAVGEKLQRRPNGVVTVAIARELAGFCWEIALAD